MNTAFDLQELTTRGGGEGGRRNRKVLEQQGMPSHSMVHPYPSSAATAYNSQQSYPQYVQTQAQYPVCSPYEYMSRHKKYMTAALSIKDPMSSDFNQARISTFMPPAARSNGEGNGGYGGGGILRMNEDNPLTWSSNLINKGAGISRFEISPSERVSRRKNDSFAIPALTSGDKSLRIPSPFVCEDEEEEDKRRTKDNSLSLEKIQERHRMLPRVSRNYRMQEQEKGEEVEEEQVIHQVPVQFISLSSEGEEEVVVRKNGNSMVQRKIKKGKDIFKKQQADEEFGKTPKTLIIHQYTDKQILNSMEAEPESFSIFSNKNNVSSQQSSVKISIGSFKGGSSVNTNSGTARRGQEGGSCDVAASVSAASLCKNETKNLANTKSNLSLSQSSTSMHNQSIASNTFNSFTSQLNTRIPPLIQQQDQGAKDEGRGNAKRQDVGVDEAENSKRRWFIPNEGIIQQNVESMKKVKREEDQEEDIRMNSRDCECEYQQVQEGEKQSQQQFDHHNRYQGLFTKRYGQMPPPGQPQLNLAMNDELMRYMFATDRLNQNRWIPQQQFPSELNGGYSQENFNQAIRSQLQETTEQAINRQGKEVFVQINPQQMNRQLDKLENFILQDVHNDEKQAKEAQKKRVLSKLNQIEQLGDMYKSVGQRIHLLTKTLKQIYQTKSQNIGGARVEEPASKQTPTQNKAQEQNNKYKKVIKRISRKVEDDNEEVEGTVETGRK